MKRAAPKDKSDRFGLSAMLFFCIVLTGCKSDVPAAPILEEKPANSLTRSGIDVLVGEWEIDLKGFENAPHFQTLPERRKKIVLDMMGKMAEDMIFRFTKDSIEIETKGKMETTPFVVLSSKEMEWVLETRPRSGSAEENKLRLSGDSLLLIGKNTEFALMRKITAPVKEDSQ